MNSKSAKETCGYRENLVYLPAAENVIAPYPLFLASVVVFLLNTASFENPVINICISRNDHF